MDILETIKKYGLCIRQIPLEVTSCYDIRHYERDKQAGKKVSEPFTITHSPTNTRTYYRASRIPLNAGYWMTQQVNNTDSKVTWDMKQHCLAPTLEESVKLWVEINVI